MSDLLTIILAAGKGTRMKSDISKVLHQVAGRPMVEHVVMESQNISEKNNIVCVVGYQASQVKEILQQREINFVHQQQQLGTGHAVLQAREYIERHQGPVLVLYGDTPLLRAQTIEKLIARFKNKKAGAAVLTAVLKNPAGYGRIIKNKKKSIIDIVEDSDATEEQQKIKEINSGVYCFDASLLLQALKNIENDNEQQEYYLTDCIKFIKNKGKEIIPVQVEDNEEILGVNSRSDLVRATAVFNQKIIKSHLEAGVTIIDPENTYIDRDVFLGKDSVVYPFTFISGDTRVGQNTVIGPYCKITSSQIGASVELKANCNINDSIIGDNCRIGPFAYIRPGTSLKEGVKVGDFVELKKAEIAEGSKVPHLSYVGDAQIGKKCNIGAGTIFANYDGEKKHQTQIEDESFIGSNTTLVAPVKVKEKGKTGAGAVVTHNVPEGATVIGVPARKYTQGKNKKEE